MPLDSTDFFSGQEKKSYEYVTNHKRALHLIRSLDKDKVHALDFETTSLSPSEGEIRLTSICGHGHAFVLDHFHCGSFHELAPILAEYEWAVFNSLFEGRWFDYHATDRWVSLLDVQHMRRAKLGGGRSLSLAIMAKLDLDIELDKAEQNSRWSEPELTQQQLDYAFLDAHVTNQLWLKWLNELTAEQYEGFLNINEAWRGTAEMEDSGLALDVEYHSNLLAWWTMKRDLAERYLRKWTPPAAIKNLNSNKQISDFMIAEMLDEKTAKSWPVTGKRGDLDLERNTLRQVAYRMPYPQSRWLGALIIYRKQQKYITTYGQKLIDSMVKFHRVRTRFNMALAVTGRYSSSSYNLQNIPKAPVVRRSFIVPSTSVGELRLILADYSSIEVRVLAEMSGDQQLLYDAVYGDVHSRSASQIFKIPFDEFTEILASKEERHAMRKAIFKGMRSRSKAFTFQLLYGAGGAALAVVLRCTDSEAYEAIDAWASIYPKAYHQRTIWFEQMNHSGFLPVQDGRTIYVRKQDRAMPVAANYPVQGTAASVMYRAVYHVHKNLYDEALRAYLAASVHDELLVYSDVSCAERAAELVAAGMIAGWNDIFPKTDTNNLLGKGNKPTIGNSWADKE